MQYSPGVQISIHQGNSHWMPSATAEHGEPDEDGRYNTDTLVRLSHTEPEALGCAHRRAWG